MPLFREKVEKQQTCDHCGGTGKLGILSNINTDPNAMMDCPTCKGKGWITISKEINRVE